MFNKQQTADRQHQQFGGYHNRCGNFKNKLQSMFGDGFEGKARWKNAFNGGFDNRKAANIEETDTAFIVSLYAAGLQKNNFNVSVTNDVLTIRYNASESGENNQNNYAHFEYEPASFERSFQLNGKVITENISATYIDGVLKVTLPKNPQASQPAHEVKVD